MLKKMSKKNKVTMLLAAVLAIVVLVGGTLAYLSMQTNEEINAFKFIGTGGGENDMNAKLIEPAFTDAEKTKALKLLPGDTILKDPQIKNTSNVEGDGVPEFVGMAITFRDGAGVPLTEAQMEKLLEVITISFENTDTWEGPTQAQLKPGQNLYYFSEVVEQGDTSLPLFSKVLVSKDATSKEINELKKELGGFEIYIEGAAAQGNISFATAKVELEKALKAPKTTP